MASAQAGQYAAALAYLTPPPDATPGMHGVQFYTDDEALVRAVSPWAAEGLRCGEAVVAIATSAHLDAFDRALQEQGHDLAASRRESRYLTIDAREALAGFMVDDAPDLRLFEDFFGPLFDRAARSSRNGQVRAYGEMVNMLWGERKAEAVLRLEECWNTLLGKRRFSLLCAYHLDEFAAHEHEPTFSEICSRHSAVSPALAHTMLPPGRAPRVVAELEQRARALETEVARSRQLEAELRAKVEQLDRLVEAERAEREESEILFRVTDATSRAATLEQIYEAALDAIASGLGVPRASVLLFDPDGVIRFKAWRGLSDAYRAAVEGHSPWKADEKAPSPVLVEDCRQDPALAALSPVFEAEKIRALAFFPLFSNGLLLGKFMLYYPEPHRFSATEKRLAQGIAHQVAFAVERKFAQQERDRILGIVSHDLRNPLGAVTMAASALLRQNVDGTTTRFVRRIVNGAERMERLISQLLDFAQARHGGGIPIRRRPTDLAEVVARVVDELETAYPLSSIDVSSSGEPTGDWDSDRIAEVLSNLIGNAIQHGGGTPVRVAVESAASGVAVEIHNGGPAIPAGLMPKLFDPYRRGGQPKSGPQNVGLGLFISREIVRAHGGAIEVKSDELAGTTFTLRLPR